MAQAVKIEGLRELEAALRELPKATARNALQRGLKKAAEPVLSAMEQRAPRETGYTSKSLAISTTLNPANRRAQKKEGKAFAEVYVGSRRGSAAMLQEFGTINNPAQPYLRPAWDATQDQALATVRDFLWQEIEKSALKRARKLAKG